LTPLAGRFFSPRGKTSARGYGTEHQKLRRKLAPAVASGQMICPRCGQRIFPGQPWDLGHLDGSEKTQYAGPEHRRCNRATAGRGERRRQSRDW
jgi:hypothetical protein